MTSEQARSTITVLFVCTGNSCRSQMAEGWARHLWGDRLEVFSAGTTPHGVDPRAVTVMAEAGVDISTHRSKHLSELAGHDPDCVITVCDKARESCPVFPSRAEILHAGFEDPPHLSRTARNEEEALAPYRRVRDQIRLYVQSLPERLHHWPGSTGGD